MDICRAPFHKYYYREGHSCDRKETTCGSVRHGCTSHVRTSEGLYASTPRFSVEVYHFILAATHVTLPKGWKPESSLPTSGIEPGPSH
jgi:hypothetical protein